MNELLVILDYGKSHEENISIIGDRLSDFALRLLFSVFPD